MHRNAARPRARLLASLTASVLVGAGLIVTQSTGAQAIDPVCQTKDYPTFDNVPAGDLTLNGSAAIVGSPGVLRVVPSVLSSGGSSFTTQKVSFLNDGSFSTAFSFRYSNQMNGGADGMVFVVQNVANNVGSLGGGMGYQGLPLSVGIEFDNWFNAGYDSDDNHVGIDVNGDINSNPRATLNGLLGLDNPNATHRAWVDYNGATDVLEVRIADSAVRPATPLLTKTIDIPATLGGVTDAYVGFTAATGAAAADHDVLNWTLTNCYQPIDGPPVVTPGGPYTGSEGQPAPLAGTVSDDVGAASHWTYAVSSADPGAACTFTDASSPTTTVTCTDDGTYTLTLTADDGQNAPVSQDATLTLVNAPPVVGAVTPTFRSACTIDLSAAFTDPGSNDTHTASIVWGDGSTSPATVTETSGAGSASATHTFTAGGTYALQATVTDDNGASGTGTASVTAKNTASRFGAPINAGGDRSVFHLGSTIPLKITVTDCAGALVTTLTPTVQVDRVSSVPGGPVNEAMVDEVATNGKAMRWTDDHYHYTLSTKRSEFFGGAALTSGSYRITVTDPTLFAPATVYIDLA